MYHSIHVCLPVVRRYAPVTLREREEGGERDGGREGEIHVHVGGRKEGDREKDP